MYDVVEKGSGQETCPVGWNGTDGILDDGRVQTPWRKRLALRGIDVDVDVDDGLTAGVIARTRQALPQDERDGLDR